MSEIQQRMPPVHTDHRHAQAVPGTKSHLPSKLENGSIAHTVPTPPSSGSVEPSDKTPDKESKENNQSGQDNKGMMALPSRAETSSTDPIHPNAKTTTHTNNGTTTTKTNISSPVCRNCKTQTTPLWRRDETGSVLCNACGLFLKLHGRPRPISLKTDTIKSRNRVKQSSNPSSKAGTSPNTPELKFRDGKSSRKSPKGKKKTGDLTPLLPAHTGKTNGASGPQNTNTSSPFPQPSAYHTHHHHHMLSHLPYLPLPNPHHQHVVQPLHHPSSTPVQFAPSLQRITSPLLLSTTSSVRGESAERSAGAAATVLEKMSARDDNSIPGLSLMGNSQREIKRSGSPALSMFSTPSSALNVEQKPTPKMASAQNPTSQKQTQGLPALGSRGPSPVPINEASNQTRLPNIQLPSVNTSQFGNGSQEQKRSSPPPDKRRPSDNKETSNNPPDPPNPNSNPTNEVTLLKTRISELELVNDLYRTRIMELEAMEQAARLREQSTRKRLDEILASQETFRPAPTAPGSGVTLPPPVLHKSGNLLPSIRGGVVLPSLKRENDDELNEAAKKQRTQS